MNRSKAGGGTKLDNHGKVIFKLYSIYICGNQIELLTNKVISSTEKLAEKSDHVTRTATLDDNGLIEKIEKLIESQHTIEDKINRTAFLEENGLMEKIENLAEVQHTIEDKIKVNATAQQIKSYSEMLQKNLNSNQDSVSEKFSS